MTLFTCPACRNRLSVAEGQAGSRVTCPSCGAKAEVPFGGPRAAEEEAEDVPDRGWVAEPDEGREFDRIAREILRPLAARPDRTPAELRPNLESCPDCGEILSKTAASCPQCGWQRYPIARAAPAPQPIVLAYAPHEPQPPARLPVSVRPAAPSAHGRRRFGRRRPVDRGPSARPPNVIYLLGATSLLLGFFLPWIDFFLFGLSGFEIARLAGFAGKTYFYFLWLIPVAAVTGVVMELILYPRGDRSVLSKLLSALSPFIAILMVTVVLVADASGVERTAGSSAPQGEDGISTQSTEPGLLHFLGIGFYTTVLGLVLTFIGARAHPKAGPGRWPRLRMRTRT